MAYFSKLKLSLVPFAHGETEFRKGVGTKIMENLHLAQ